MDKLKDIMPLKEGIWDKRMPNVWYSQLCFGNTKTLAHRIRLSADAVGFFSSARGQIQKMEGKMPVQLEKQTRNKGGRPPKEITRNKGISVKCTVDEKREIETKATQAGLDKSEYIRRMCLEGKIEYREKQVPREMLALTGTLNHMAANLNQIAKKRNSYYEQLLSWELNDLRRMSSELKDIAKSIKSYLQ